MIDNQIDPPTNLVASKTSKPYLRAIMSQHHKITGKEMTGGVLLNHIAPVFQMIMQHTGKSVEDTCMFITNPEGPVLKALIEIKHTNRATV